MKEGLCAGARLKVGWKKAGGRYGGRKCCRGWCARGGIHCDVLSGSGMTIGGCGGGKRWWSVDVPTGETSDDVECVRLLTSSSLNCSDVITCVHWMTSFICRGVTVPGLKLDSCLHGSSSSSTLVSWSSAVEHRSSPLISETTQNIKNLSLVKKNKYFKSSL